MNRTHNCGELSIENVGQTVTLTGWVHSSTPLNDTVLVDLRDTRGITRLVVDTLVAEELVKTEETLGRDWAQVTGVVVERQYKNPETKTGDIEIRVSEVKILSKSNIINIKQLIWAYENFGFGAAIRFFAYGVIAILAFMGYCLTLPFQFIWLVWKNLKKK